MIASVTGTRTVAGLDWVVLEVGGIGVKLLVTPGTVSELLAGHSEQPVTLHTVLIVREDSLTLYGFHAVAERETFEILLSVSGIGPRTALAALSVLTPAELAQATESEDLTTLQRIPGVGKKSAQRILLELTGKLGALSSSGETPAAPSHNHVRSEVEAALEQLGWTKAVAAKTVEGLQEEHRDASSLLRAALLSLGNNRG